MVSSERGVKERVTFVCSTLCRCWLDGLRVWRTMASLSPLGLKVARGS